jgi:two-component system sensor histidine kinase FlrB
MELFAGLIAESPEQSEEWVSHLRAGIRSLSGTVNNVLTLHGDAAPRLERLDLRRELELAIEFIRPLAKQAEVAVSLLADEGALAIRGNKSAIHQILLNLCSNALRHTTPGGTLRICVERSAGQVAVHVEDSGCGIAADFLPRLFHERFSGSGSSSGLGLAVCGRLMRQHGGAISVESQPGYGSTFTLEFPSL